MATKSFSEERNFFSVGPIQQKIVKFNFVRCCSTVFERMPCVHEIVGSNPAVSWDQDPPFFFPSRTFVHQLSFFRADDQEGASLTMFHETAETFAT